MHDHSIPDAAPAVTNAARKVERDRSATSARRRRILSMLSAVLHVVVVFALLAGGAYLAYWFNATAGTSKRTEGSAEEASRLVEIVAAERGDRPVRIRAMGTVMPAREAVIRPRVSGMIVEQSDAFSPGGFFEEGEFMVQIERTDYEHALQQRETELAQAEAALQIELGDQAVAREELELLAVDIPEINRDLILRIPQVNQAKAQVRSAEVAIERARLDLERTRLAAPFDGQIVIRSVSAGNNVAAGDELATFVGAERYWIEVAVPVSSLRWIDVPRSPPQPGSPARVVDHRAWGDAAFREGSVTQLVGRLEQGSRLARVIVTVPDPLARDESRAGKPQLILGAFVEVEIEGRELAGAFVVDRNHVREGDVVWVMGDDDRLEIKPITIAHRGRDQVFVTRGLADGDRVVRTNLTAPVRGMLLRVASPDDARDTSTVGLVGDGF